jgi:aminobenzoyl-glutamate transport protein
MLAGLTQQAAQLYDGSYVVRATANWYFMAASVIVLTAVATWVSVRIVEPRLGPWQPADAQPRPATEPLKPLERSGLAAALVSFAACIALICVLVVPKDAPLRDPANPSDLSPFYNSLVALLTLVFFVPGLTYGLWTRAIRSDRQASGMMSDTMATMGAYIVMAFFASQAIAYFQWSQLGMIIAMEGASLLRAAHFTGVPLFITFIIITASINILIASASAKWTMIAPVFVPMFMALGYSPEMTQALYRVGDSVTNVITPLNYYLPSIIIPIAQRYVPKAGIGTIIAAMLPYSIAFFIVWGGMIVIWLSLGLPIGPDAPLQYVPPQ